MNAETRSYQESGTLNLWAVRQRRADFVLTPVENTTGLRGGGHPTDLLKSHLPQTNPTAVAQRIQAATTSTIDV